MEDKQKNKKNLGIKLLAMLSILLIVLILINISIPKKNPLEENLKSEISNEEIRGSEETDIVNLNYEAKSKEEKLKQEGFGSIPGDSRMLDEDIIIKYNKEIKDFPIRIEFTRGLSVKATSGTAISGNAVSNTDSNLKSESYQFFDKYKAILGVNKEELKQKRTSKVGKQEYILFEQEYKGLPVYLGNVMLVQSNDKWMLYNSNFYNNINIGIKPKISKEKAIEIAKKEYVTSDNLLEKPELIIYPYLSKNVLKYYLAYRLEFPYGKYNDKVLRPTIFVDSIEGKIINVLDNIRTETVSGKITGEIIPDYPEQARQIKDFSNEDVKSGTYTTTSDSSGNYNFEIGSNPKISSSLEGPWVKIINNIQANAIADINVPPYQANIDWNIYDNSYKKEESNVFYHVNRVHNYFTNGEPPFNIDELNYKMNANVEVNGKCNAYADGTSINFFKASAECEALSLYSDVIYHEYTHNVVHRLAPILADKYYGETGNMNEGYADYFACTLNDATCLGDNWAGHTCLRNCENTKRYPEDYDDEPHFGAEIISGSIWDIRKTLGKDMTDSIAVIALSYDPQTFSELLVNFLIADDATYGNGDLSDGTPNVRLICESFYNNHGIFNINCLNYLSIISVIDYIPIFLENSIIDIKGTASGTQFKNYILYYGVGKHPSEWIEIVNNDQQVINDVLYENFDTGLLVEPYSYIKLVVFDNSGESKEIVYKIVIESVVQITHRIFKERYPDIYENKIVWEGWRNGNSDIYMYNLDTNEERQITYDISEQENPDIYENKIVWLDWRNGNSDIYMYNLDTNEERRITTDNSNQFAPSIYENKIVWRDWRNRNSDIYMYNLDTNEERRITTDNSNQFTSSIYENKIVWEDWRNRNSDIYMYNLDTNEERRITTDNSNQFTPSIYENKIVWQDWRNARNGNSDIYMYNLDTNEERQITYDSSDQDTPSIYENKIVWEDWRNGNSDIYMHDLRNGIPESKLSNLGNSILTGTLSIKLQKKDPSGNYVDVNEVINQQISVPVDGVLKLDTGKDNLGNQVFPGFNNMNVRADSVGEYRVYARFESAGQIIENNWEFEVIDF